MSRDADILLIEAETHAGYHSTGRSAAILAQTYGGKFIHKLTCASQDFFESPPEGFAEHPLLTPRGLVQIAREDQMDALLRQYEDMSDTGLLRWLDRDELRTMVPILRDGYATGGFVNAAAQDIDVAALHQGYLRQLRAAGGTIATDARVSHMDHDGADWHVTAGTIGATAPVVINAAGAWAEQIAALAGAAPIGMVPMRRTAITIAPPAGLAPASLPMIVDCEEQFYLKPEAGRLMASPADETPSAPTDAQPEELDIAQCVDRIERAFDLSVRRVESKWAGLRSFVPDRAPVVGPDPEVRGFYWLAAQGGYGVQTAPGLARYVADALLARTAHPAIKAADIDPMGISPARLRRG